MRCQLARLNEGKNGLEGFIEFNSKTDYHSGACGFGNGTICGGNAGVSCHGATRQLTEYFPGRIVRSGPVEHHNYHDVNNNGDNNGDNNKSHHHLSTLCTDRLGQLEASNALRYTHAGNSDDQSRD